MADCDFPDEPSARRRNVGEATTTAPQTTDPGSMKTTGVVFATQTVPYLSAGQRAKSVSMRQSVCRVAPSESRPRNVNDDEQAQTGPPSAPNHQGRPTGFGAGGAGGVGSGVGGDNSNSLAMRQGRCGIQSTTTVGLGVSDGEYSNGSEPAPREPADEGSLSVPIGHVATAVLTRGGSVLPVAPPLAAVPALTAQALPTPESGMSQHMLVARGKSTGVAKWPKPTGQMLQGEVPAQGAPQTHALFTESVIEADAVKALEMRMMGMMM